MVSGLLKVSKKKKKKKKKGRTIVGALIRKKFKFTGMAISISRGRSSFPKWKI